MPFDPDSVREFERAGWNRAAAAYEASFSTATRPFIDPLLDAAAIGAGQRVLDLCCGPGFVAAAAASRPEGLPPEEEIPDAPDEITEPEGGRE